MNVGQLIDRVRDFVSEYVDQDDTNEDNVYFKRDHILRTLNEAQDIVQQKLIQYDTNFLVKEDDFTIPEDRKLFIPDMFTVLLVSQNGADLFPFDSAQKNVTSYDYEIFGNKIIFKKGRGGKVNIRYVKKAEELKEDMQIPEIPAGFHHVLSKYAAAMLTGIDEAFNLSKFFDEKYETGVKEMNNVSIQRQHQEPRYVLPGKRNMGFGSTWGGARL